MQIGLALYYLTGIVGVAGTMACLLTIVASMPLTAVFSRVISRVQRRKMAAKDARVAATSEALGAMSIVKASGGECIKYNVLQTH